MESMIKISTKCQFLFTLMEDLIKNGHRLLIFSMSKKMLYLLEEIIKSLKNAD
jgi:SNF2 family DNA or RNA helicase